MLPGCCADWTLSLESREQTLNGRAYDTFQTQKLGALDAGFMPHPDDCFAQCRDS